MADGSRLDRIGNTIQDLQKGMGRLESDVAHPQTDVTDIKATLTQLMPMIVRIDQKLSDAPSATEVAELRGRIEEQSKFLQLALAGRQPKRPAAE